MLVQQQDVYFQPTLETRGEDQDCTTLQAETLRIIATPSPQDHIPHFCNSPQWERAEKIFVATGVGVFPPAALTVRTRVHAGKGSIVQLEQDQGGWLCVGTWTSFELEKAVE